MNDGPAAEQSQYYSKKSPRPKKGSHSHESHGKPETRPDRTDKGSRAKASANRRKDSKNRSRSISPWDNRQDDRRDGRRDDRRYRSRRRAQKGDVAKERSEAELATGKEPRPRARKDADEQPLPTIEYLDSTDSEAFDQAPLRLLEFPATEPEVRIRPQRHKEQMGIKSPSDEQAVTPSRLTRQVSDTVAQIQLQLVVQQNQPRTENSHQRQLIREIEEVPPQTTRLIEWYQKLSPDHREQVLDKTTQKQLQTGSATEVEIPTTTEHRSAAAAKEVQKANQLRDIVENLEAGKPNPENRAEDARKDDGLQSHHRTEDSSATDVVEFQGDPISNTSDKATAKPASANQRLNRAEKSGSKRSLPGSEAAEVRIRKHAELARADDSLEAAEAMSGRRLKKQRRQGMVLNS